MDLNNEESNLFYDFAIKNEGNVGQSAAPTSFANFSDANNNLPNGTGIAIKSFLDEMLLDETGTVLSSPSSSTSSSVTGTLIPPQPPPPFFSAVGPWPNNEDGTDSHWLAQSDGTQPISSLTNLLDPIFVTFTDEELEGTNTYLTNDVVSSSTIQLSPNNQTTTTPWVIKQEPIEGGFVHSSVLRNALEGATTPSGPLPPILTLVGDTELRRVLSNPPITSSAHPPSPSSSNTNTSGNINESQSEFYEFRLIPSNGSTGHSYEDVLIPNVEDLIMTSSNPVEQVKPHSTTAKWTSSSDVTSLPNSNQQKRKTSLKKQVKQDQTMIAEADGESTFDSSNSAISQCNRKERSLHYCTLCNKGFKDKYSVTVHVRCHTGEKPFACSMCGKNFRQKAHLAKHYQTHTAKGNNAKIRNNKLHTPQVATC